VCSDGATDEVCAAMGLPMKCVQRWGYRWSVCSDGATDGVSSDEATDGVAAMRLLMKRVQRWGY